MKRLIIVTMVVLMGVSGTAIARHPTLGNPYGYGYGRSSWVNLTFIDRAYHPTLRNPYGYGRSSWVNSTFIDRAYHPTLRNPYGYECDSTLGRVLGYGGLAMDAFQTLSGISATDRVLDNQISATNRRLIMDEREQEFRHQQIRDQARIQRKTVLVTRSPVIRRVPVGRQVKEPEKVVFSENQKLWDETEKQRQKKEQLQEEKELQERLDKLKKEVEELEKLKLREQAKKQ